MFAEKCVDGIEANKAGTERLGGRHARGRDGAERRDRLRQGHVIVKKATASGRPLREVALEEGVDAKLYDETIDLRKIARGTRPERVLRSP